MRINIITEYSPELEKLVLDILSKKADGVLFRHGGETASKVYFYINDAETIGISHYARDKFGPPYSEVTAAQFLTVLESRLDKDDVFETRICGYNTKITKDKIEIGCQEYSPEEFAKIGEAIDQLKKGVTVQFPDREEIVVTQDSVYSSGTTFPLDQYDLIVAKLKELQEKKK